MSKYYIFGCLLKFGDFLSAVGSIHNIEGTWFLECFLNVRWSQDPFTPGFNFSQSEICLTKFLFNSDSTKMRGNFSFKGEAMDIMVKFCRTLI